MPIARLAKATDYVPFEQGGKELYWIPWEPLMGPGNPTDEPEEGVALFNDWQCARAAGRELPREPEEQLHRILVWCVDHHADPGASQIARDIVRVYREPDLFFDLDASADDYPGQAFVTRCDLAFLNSAVKRLPAEIIFKINYL